MRIRTIIAATVLAAAAALPMAGLAHAQTSDRDCPDFASQAAAQAAFDSTTGDPERLDRDNDNEACEDYDYVPSSGNASDNSSTDSPASTDKQITAVPRGGLETGDGSASGDGAPGLLVLGGLATLGAGAVALRHRARRTG